MAYGEETSNNPFSDRKGDLQMAILTQLLQVSTAMRHIDELLLWLTNLMVYRFGAQIAETWANQDNYDGEHSLELRSVTYRNGTFPQNIAVNAQVAMVAGRLLVEQRTTPVQQVDMIFPQHVTTLLKRHGLPYYSSIFLSSPFLLPPPSTSIATAKIPTPLTIVVLLFFRQIPAQDVSEVAGSIYQQALSIARTRELLLLARSDSSPANSNAWNSTTVPNHTPITVLSGLVPHRVQDAASNPFGGEVIADKQARRLYAALDGRRNINTLCEFLRLDMKTVLGLLQMLLAQQRIQLYEPGGKLVDSSVLSNRQ